MSGGALRDHKGNKVTNKIGGTDTPLVVAGVDVDWLCTKTVITDADGRALGERS